MGKKMAKMSVSIYTYIPIYIYIYPITLNGYIYSPGKKIEKIKKKSKKSKKLKKIKNARNNFWGPCQVLNIYRYISQQSILKQGFQKTHFPIVLEVEIFFAVDLANF